MEDEKNVQSANENKAGCLGIGVSFFAPLLGVIIYFVQKRSVVNADAYLKWALAGFVISMLLSIIGSAAGA